MRSSTIRAGLAQRARIVLLAADGLPNVEIAERVGVSRPTVTSWRARYARSGIGGLAGSRPVGSAAHDRPPQDRGRDVDSRRRRSSG